jgi:hypothetical protein
MFELKIENSCRLLNLNGVLKRGSLCKKKVRNCQKEKDQNSCIVHFAILCEIVYGKLFQKKATKRTGQQ